MHASYYYRAHACIMVFDVTRKVTYKNLETWYDELQEHCKGKQGVLMQLMELLLLNPCCTAGSLLYLCRKMFAQILK
jgi:GTPase SAR1 family protein